MFSTFSFIAALCGGVVLAVPGLGAGDRAKLERGEVLVHRLEPTGGNGVAARAFGLVDATPDEVWPVVRDCQHFARFMPRTKKSRLISMDDEVSVCEVEIHMPFPLSNLVATTRSTMRTLPEGGHERRWSLVEGDYRRNDGSWEVRPWGEDGRRSLLVYWLDVDPKVLVPDAIIRKAQTGSLPDVFAAVRKRVAELRRSAGR